jgi:hypothetical protein
MDVKICCTRRASKKCTILSIGRRRAVAWLWIAAGLCGIVVLASLLLPRADGQLIDQTASSTIRFLRSAVFDRDFDFANDYQLLQVDTIASSA